MSGARCPECRDGKHVNCTGWAFDSDDIEIPCACPCRAEPSGRVVCPSCDLAMGLYVDPANVLRCSNCGWDSDDTDPAPNPDGTPGDVQRDRYTLTAKGLLALFPRRLACGHILCAPLDVCVYMPDTEKATP